MISQVSIANALPDRAYGKPAVTQEKETVNFSPVVIELTKEQLRAMHFPPGLISTLDMQDD